MLPAVIPMVVPAPPTPEQRLELAREEQLEYGDNTTPWSDRMAFIADTKNCARVLYEQLKL